MYKSDHEKCGTQENISPWTGPI